MIRSGLPRFLAASLVLTATLASALATGSLRSAEAAAPAPPFPRPPQTIDVTPTAWSGWWWPMLEARGNGPHLFDENGPLDRYDRLAQALGRQNPGTRAWALQYMRTTDPENGWWGYCNGWAAASILEPQPTRASTIGGTSFSVAAKKGLLTAWHQSTGTLFQFGGSEGLPAVLFHRAILDWVVQRGTPLIVNTYNVQGNPYQVWNYPVVRARLSYTPDAADLGVTHVAATLWFADDAVPADFVGTRYWPGPGGVLYTYRLTGDPGNPLGGQWEGTSAGSGLTARPSLVWYPDPTWRYSPALTPPGLDYDLVTRIARD